MTGEQLQLLETLASGYDNSDLRAEERMAIRAAITEIDRLGNEMAKLYWQLQDARKEATAARKNYEETPWSLE